MADATTPTTINEVPDAKGLSLQIANAVNLLKGRFAGIRGPTHGTSQGYLDDYDDEPGNVFAGVVESAGGLAIKTGDTSGTPPPEGGIKIYPRILKRYAVTGAASRADILKPVYATDNQTLDLTRPADDAEAVGLIVEWHTGTTCDVLLFGLIGQCLLGMAGGNVQEVDFGSYDFADLADGNIRIAQPMRFHGKILSVIGYVEKAHTGSGGTALVNLEINGTNVTGGVVTVSTAAAGTLGTILAGTAVTAENVFHEGDTVDVEVASAGGTRTLGRVRIVAVCERLPGP